MKEILSKSVVDNELLDNNIDYVVNVINDKTLRNQIQIEILAKNLKKKHKDVKLRIESELITTIIEENHKLNRVKKTTIRTKLMPKLNNVQTESISDKPTATSDKAALANKASKKEKKVANKSPIRSIFRDAIEVEKREEGQLSRTGSSDSGLSENSSFSKSKNDIKKLTDSDIFNRQCELLQKHSAIVNKNGKKKRITDDENSMTKSLTTATAADSSLEDLSTSSAPEPEIKTTNFVLESIKRINRLSASEIAKENKPIKRIRPNSEILLKTKEIPAEEPKQVKDVQVLDVASTNKTDDEKYQPSTMLRTLNFLLREKYKKIFKLTDPELEIIFSFYNQNRSGSSIDISDMEKFLHLTSKSRKEVKANGDDIKSALTAVDSDKDNKISLDEFLHLLVLFFADKSNLSERLISVLRNQSIFHQRIGWLNPTEAAGFIEFCFRFFGRFVQLTEPIKESVEYTSLALQLTPALVPYLHISGDDVKF